MNEPILNPVESVDFAFLLIFGISIFILLCIVATMIYFVIRYRRAKHPVAADIDGNLFAEVIWTLVPTLIVLGMFHYGWVSYKSLRNPPPGSMPVKVEARMWSWKFTYENGKTSNTLVVPVGRPIKLELSSVDVLHGFFVPAFRLKIDTVPGMPTMAWFLAERPGEHDIFCTVYCGLKHADMISLVKAVSPEDFEKWLNEKPALSGAAAGQALFEQNGCSGCHSFDGSVLAGPSLKGVFGHEVTLVKDGKEEKRTADADYLRGVILNAKRPLLKGFDPMMPAYAGTLSEEQVNQIIEFIKADGKLAAPKPDGAALASSEGCTGCHSLDGSALVGPSFKGLFGSSVELEGAPGKVKVDREYVLKAISGGERKRAKGYPPLMPAYPDLSQEQKEALADYLQSLAGGHSH